MCFVMITAALNTLYAQKIITVSGKILELSAFENKLRPFPSNEKVYVFSFNTLEAAKDALQCLDRGETIMYESLVIADSNGDYEILASENGALIIRVAMRSELIEVKGRDVINCNIEGNYIFIDTEPITTTPIPESKPQASKINGVKLVVNNYITIPNGYGAANKRLILRPFLVDCQTEDTIKGLKPIVLDGKKYRQQNDPYAPFVDRRRLLTEEKLSIYIEDTIEIDNPMNHYSVSCNLVIKKKNKIVYEDNLKLTTCKVKRPFMFLELIDTTNKSLKEAFNQCSKGYFDYRGAPNMEEKRKREKIFELVKNSSPINHAVMCMAMETPYYDKEAKEVLDKMAQTTQVKYMKLQLFIRENRLYDDPRMVFPFSREEANFKEACKMLDLIIKEDSKYQKIAENDGEITQEFMDFYADPFNWEDILNLDF